MKRIARGGVMLAFVLALDFAADRGAQAQTITTPSGQRIVVAGAPADPAPDTSKLTDKQRLLASETEQLLAMATELKAQVDMTSKNILSMKVVRKAEQIELYAHTLKGQAKGGAPLRNP